MSIDEALVAKYRAILEVQMRAGYSLDDAQASQVTPDDPALAAAVAEIHRDHANTWFGNDPNIPVLDVAEASLGQWYGGPIASDRRWNVLRSHLQSNLIDSVDRSSTLVVSRLSSPHNIHSKKRGLVLGHVQSGKTANYAATIAKAADAGYRIVIVLAGLHDNLRNQTQARLDRDLGLGSHSQFWHSLTKAEEDFLSGGGVNNATLSDSRVSFIAVVKKNSYRLRRLLTWLRSLPAERLARAPVLLLDDEADQATPNSSASAATITAINRTLRKIWEVIPTGTYLAYTATPFANVFMDPDEQTELFPSDFLVALPRPANYFGAERIFGSTGESEGSEASEGLDVVRVIPADEGDQLRPARSEKDHWSVSAPASLIDAIRWFLLATAIRRARGETAHNSMLIHTSQFVAAHNALADTVRAVLQGILARWEVDDPVDPSRDDEFRTLFACESERAAEVRSVALPPWPAVAAELYRVSLDTQVIVDNGQSLDRLNYDKRDSAGESLPQTVIAIGGATLSRGLTLEGLTVSYFSRPATTYDSLLQMGRWFGYRVGYEDLPRIWMTEQMAQEFLFLATVEQDLRNEIDYLDATGRSPRDAGVRVREHPGRLAITGAPKMRHATKVQLGLSGMMQQTFIFQEQDAETIAANTNAVRGLLSRALSEGRELERIRNGRLLLRELAADDVVRMLSAYQFHPAQSELLPQLITRWIREAAAQRPWNVVVATVARRNIRSWDGRVVDLGQMSLGLGEPVNTVNRAPLAAIRDSANIKGLLSLSDRVADLELPPDAPSGQGLSDKYFRSQRAALDGGQSGLLLIYPISRHSVPTRAVGGNPPSRRPMEAAEHLVGLGLVYPNGADVGLTSNDWVSVRNRYDTQLAEEQEELTAEVGDE